MMQSFETSVQILCPAGALTAASIGAFQQELMSALSCEHTGEYLLDLSNVDAVDNAGLVLLMTAFNTAQSLSKRLSLCSVPPSIRIVFELAQLDRLFTLEAPTSAALPAAA